MAEEKEELQDEKQPNTFLTKAKIYLSKARMSRYLGLGGVLAGIIVYSLLDVGWNPWLIGWQKFIANVSLLIFIGVYGIFFGENEGNQRFKNYIYGLYKTCVIKLRNTVKKITEKDYLDWLPDYIPWRYKKDYDNKCKMKMLSVRLFDHSVLDLKDEEIEELRIHPIKSGENYYSRISEEQYNVISDIRQGKVFVDYFTDYTFYTMEDNTENDEQIVTKVKKTPERKEKISWQQRLSRLGMVFLTALILAGFYKQMREGDSNAATDLMSRMVTLFVSIASGINTARLLNLEDCFVLKYKISYDEVFLSCCENGSFKPVDYKSKSKEEYEKYIKNKPQEVKAEVVEKRDINLPAIRQ